VVVILLELCTFKSSSCRHHFLHHLLLEQIQDGLTVWYRLTQVVMETSVVVAVVYRLRRLCYTARKLAAVQCTVIGLVCGFMCLQRAGGVRTLLYSQRARRVCVSLSAFFHFICRVRHLTFV